MNIKDVARRMWDEHESLSWRLLTEARQRQYVDAVRRYFALDGIYYPEPRGGW